MKLNKKLAISACKSSRWLIRKLDRGGTTFPGAVALKFDKDILREVSKGVRTIIVAGTNGKTTTALMIAQGLRAAGYDCFSNSSGANMLYGVAAEYIMNLDSKGKPIKNLAVIEVDEASLKYVVPAVDPDVVLVTNVFRDQLDRYGEVLSTLKIINDGISQNKGMFVLNGDCSLLANRGENDRTLYYGFDTALPYSEKEVTDVTRCIRCGAKMQYHSHTFGHLGDFYCEECGYSKPKTAVSLSSFEGKIDGSHISVTSGEKKYDINLALPAVYNAYNALSAIAVFNALGIDEKPLIETLENMKSAFGRMEKFTCDGKDIEMILVKNPAGCARVLEYLKDIDENFTLAFLLNDNDQDGKDISWIWDTDFATFVESREGDRYITGGTRKSDMALRLRYAGVEKIEIADSYEEVFEKITEGEGPAVIIPNYTSMLTMRKVLQKNCGGKDIWE